MKVFFKTIMISFFLILSLDIPYLYKGNFSHSGMIMYPNALDSGLSKNHSFFSIWDKWKIMVLRCPSS